MRLVAGSVIGWILLALFEAMALHFDAVRAGRESLLGPILVDRLAADAVWLIVAAAVLTAVPRMLDRGVTAGALAIRCVLLGLVLAPLYSFGSAAAYTMLHGGGLEARMRGIAITTVIWGVFVYALMAVTASLLWTSRRAIALHTKLARAELELLRGQLEPHFLFNALNTIAGLIRTDRAQDATTALGRLSELLRYVIDASRQERVPLAWELDLVTSYLELQQLRFGTRLQFAITHEPATRSRELPPLLLQPLVENAVVHGVARTTEPATLAVAVTLVDDKLRIVVTNTCGEPATDTTGVGLRNTRDRLARIYGDRASLDAGPTGSDGYRVTLVVPV
ncbi:MAG: histidine kinase [Kofleriaceae bacterium]